MQVDPTKRGHIHSSAPSTTSDSMEKPSLMDSLANGAHQTMSFISNNISKQTRTNAQNTLEFVFLAGITLAMPAAMVSIQADKPALAALTIVAPLALGAAAAGARFLLGSELTLH
jgi:hypothetical protein